MLYTSEELERLVMLFNENYYSTCFYCGRHVVSRKVQISVSPMNQRTIDHVVPRSRGGSDCRSNKVLCCRSCNTVKRDKTIEEFRLFRYNSVAVEFFFETDIRRRIGNGSIKDFYSG